jgi:large subunit ribosomal protein L10
MAVSKAKKISQVESLNLELKDVSNGFIAEYGKLTVAQDDELRKSVRGAGAKYRVVKNTLAKRAAEGTAFADVAQALKGRTSIAYTEGDIVALAKALTEYAKQNPELRFKSGVVDGETVDAKQIEVLASLPSRDELFSKLLFLINAPATRLATAMSGVGRKVATVIDQGVKESKFQAGGEASA